MTCVVFYHNASERLEAAVEFLTSAYHRGKKIFVFVPAQETADTLDRLLWSMPPAGFLPHAFLTDDDHDAQVAAETPILLARSLAALQRPDLSAPAASRLLSLAEDMPDEVIAAISRFTYLFEVVGQDAEGRQSARTRVARYKAADFEIKYIDLVTQGESA
jgi:DNA polymerase-3 subunit chi